MTMNGSMHVPGITILYTKPTAKDPKLFSFLSPLSLGVWIYMATAYLAVSLLLYVLARYLSVTHYVYSPSYPHGRDFRISPYETGGLGGFLFTASSPPTHGPDVTAGNCLDEKGARLARPDPLYESLFPGGKRQRQQQQQPQFRVELPPPPPPAAPAAPEEETTFTLLNSFWFMIASLLQQGTDLLPR